MPEDPALERAVDWFRAQPRMAERFGDAIRQSFDEVLDGQRTGRYGGPPTRTGSGSSTTTG